MHDGLQTIVKWNRRLEQLCRDLGFEILEPLEPTAPAMEPLTWPEVLRAARWPGVFALTLASFASYYLFEPAGFSITTRFIATLAINFAAMQLLMPRAFRRAYRRRRSSLEA